jgi:hypothetical protein
MAGLCSTLSICNLEPSALYAIDELAGKAAREVISTGQPLLVESSYAADPVACGFCQAHRPIETGSG